MDDSINPKGITSIKFDENAKYDVQSDATSTINREDVL
jgi:predicted small secreted protein